MTIAYCHCLWPLPMVIAFDLRRWSLPMACGIAYDHCLLPLLVAKFATHKFRYVAKMFADAQKDYKRLSNLAKRVNTFLGEVITINDDQEPTTTTTAAQMIEICAEMKQKTGQLKAALQKMVRFTKE